MRGKIKKLKYKFDELIIREDSSWYKNVYYITLRWDANDADYMPITIRKSESEFEKDFGLKLILSLVNERSTDDNNKLFPGDWNTPRYGHYLEENKDLPGLDMYFSENDMASFTESGDMCHSIDMVEILYYNDIGKASVIKLPEFDLLFETKEEAVQILNHFLKEYVNEDEDDD